MGSYSKIQRAAAKTRVGKLEVKLPNKNEKLTGSRRMYYGYRLISDNNRKISFS